MKSLLLSVGFAALAATALAQAPAAPAKSEEVCVLKTNLGTMVFRFFDQEAPANAAHIKKLVREGFFDSKIFYRVVKGHVIQTGDGEGDTGPKVKAEINNHLHIEGAVGLAHGPDPDSGTTEIYICLAPRPHLDGKFTVFGQVIEGQEVLEKIGDVPVDEHFEGTAAFHKPKQPVVIEKATIETRNLTP
jgi:cyclophilin family peptidyl-prolyl cis-trans isomerase